MESFLTNSNLAVNLSSMTIRCHSCKSTDFFHSLALAVVRRCVNLSHQFKRLMIDSKRYTVRYRDFSSHLQEECFYASDAFEARVLAMEAIRYLHDHPHAIDLIRCEGKIDSTAFA